MVFPRPGGAQESRVVSEVLKAPVRVEKTVLTVSPRLTAVSLDGRVYSSVSAKSGRSEVTAAAGYNSKTDELSFAVEYRYPLFSWTWGFFVSDQVEFHKLFEGRRFIARDRSGGMLLRIPVGPGEFFWKGFGGEFEEIHDTTPVVERSQIYKYQAGWEKRFRSGFWEAHVEQALPVGEGDFSYEKIETRFALAYPVDASWEAGLEGFLGGPSRKGSKYSTFQAYYLGGWETLKGRRLQELSGDFAAALETFLRIPAFSLLSDKLHFLATLGWQAAAAGGPEIFEEGSLYSFSAAAGGRLRWWQSGMHFFLEGQWAHPVSPEKKNVFYLVAGIE